MSRAKVSPVAQAYLRCKPARDALRQRGARCMETTEDKAGILWERWVITSETACLNLLLWSTPRAWDVFAPLTKDVMIESVVAAIKAVQP